MSTPRLLKLFRCSPLLLLTLASPPHLPAQLSFTGLGLDYTASNIMGVSNQGVVIGHGNDYSTGTSEGFSWTKSSGYTPFGTAFPRDVTPDGTTIVGTRVVGDDQRPFRWTEKSGLVDLGSTPGYPNTAATSVSSDGSIVLLTGHDPNTQMGQMYLRSDSGLQPVGKPPNSRSISGVLSNDGTVVGGTAERVSAAGIYSWEAYRWTEDSGAVGLGFLPGTTSNTVESISGDGTTLVGSNRVGFDSQAFRWTEAMGIESLGTLDRFGFEDTTATSVTNDGSVIVGNAGDSSRGQVFVWTPETGMLSLTDVLNVQFGLEEELRLWKFRQPLISDNGRFIAGSGTWGDNTSRSWLIDRGENPEPFQIPVFPPVPEPATYGIIGAIGLGVVMLRRRWAQHQAT